MFSQLKLQVATQPLTPLAQLIGLIILFYLLALKPLNWLLNWCTRINSDEILKPEEDFYAIVTGATDGIGLEYVRQLARRGYNLLLLSRSEEKLQRVAKESHEQYPQCKRIEILAVDFSQTDIYDKIRKKLVALDGRIHVLVNNVGIAFDYPARFADVADGFHLRLININIVAATLMSEMVLQLMKQQKIATKHSIKGVIIMVSSVFGKGPIPLCSTYSASKAYMNYLGRLLAAEYGRSGILVQTVNPNLVTTKMIQNILNPLSSLATVSAPDCVRFALDDLGAGLDTDGHPWHRCIFNIAWAMEQLIGEPLFMRLKLAVAFWLRGEYDKTQKNNN